MIDDDVSTLLKLDERGIHAGGTVQAGSRPVLVASGGITLNPPRLPDLPELPPLPDLEAARATLGSLGPTALRELKSAARRLPDTGSLQRDLQHDALGLQRDAQDLQRQGARWLLGVRQAFGLAPRSRSLLTRMPAIVPVLVGAGVVAAIAIGAAVLADPARRRRLVARLRRRHAEPVDVTASYASRTGGQERVAIPVQPADPIAFPGQPRAGTNSH